jgi:hypothetical protein
MELSQKPDSRARALSNPLEESWAAPISGGGPRLSC